jgi:hypothetical protein
MNHVLIWQAIGEALMLCKSPVQGTENTTLGTSNPTLHQRTSKQPKAGNGLRRRGLTQGRRGVEMEDEYRATILQYKPTIQEARGFYRS